MSAKGCALIVDDKIAPLKWAFDAVNACGYSEERVLMARYGDEALKVYRGALAAGKVVDVVVSDYHMNVKKKPPQGIERVSFSGAKILDGVALAQEIFMLSRKQKFCLISAGLDNAIKQLAESAGIQLIMHKRRPEDRQFTKYVETLSGYIANDL